MDNRRQRASPNLRALVAVAEPTNLSTYGLPPIDVSGEVAWIRATLGDIPTVVLPAPCSGERATLATIERTLRDAVSICWLVGAVSMRNSESCLWLEQPDGVAVPVSARVLATHLARIPLVVLSPPGSVPMVPGHHAITRLARDLAQGGIPAVLTLPSALGETDAAPCAATFFATLRDGGRVNDALRAARASETQHAAPGTLALFHREADGHSGQG